MNTTKLRKNKTFNSYKEICEFIGEKVKQHKADKEVQLEQWKKYFEFHTNGRKFIIDKVLVKDDNIVLENGNKNNGGNNTSEYSKDVNPIVLDMLSKLYEDGKFDICLTTTEVLKMFLGHDNPIIEEYKNIDGTNGEIRKRIIIDFMTSKRKKIWGIVNTSLGALSKKCKMKVMRNCMRAKLSNGTYIWLEPLQITEVLTVKDQVLEELSKEKGYEINLSNVRRYGLADKFNKRCRTLFKELDGVYKDIQYTFDATRVILSKQFSKELLERKQFLEHFDNFNVLTEKSDRKTINKYADKYAEIKGNDLKFTAKVFTVSNGINVKGDRIKADLGYTFAEPTAEQILEEANKYEEFESFKKEKESERYIVYNGLGNSIIDEIYEWIEEHKEEIDNIYGKYN